jgi:cysteine-S-conjugate beta-lyase
MAFNFDILIDRSATNSIKWKLFGPDVLPLWVADMDFAAPEPVQNALQRAVEHGVYGYEFPSRELCETVAARMERLYAWQVPPEAVIATPGVIAGFNAAARAVCAPGEGLLVQPPVYPPFLGVNANHGLVRQEAGLRCETQGSRMHYEIDWDVLEGAVDGGGARTAMFLLCSPHNPTGKVFSNPDLARMADLCARNGIVVCSDEIHAELLLGTARHIPLAALKAAPAPRTVTLIAPSKTFNVPGLFCAFAIVPDEELRDRYKKAVEQLAMHVNNFGLVAAQAAYSGECDDWLAALRSYLTANRDLLVTTIESEFHGVKVTVPDGTYLAWLDCNDLVRSGRIEGSAHKFFLHRAKVALNEGADFGPGGEGFVRLNFGCPRRTLTEALEKMKAALQ